MGGIKNPFLGASYPQKKWVNVSKNKLTNRQLSFKK